MAVVRIIGFEEGSSAGVEGVTGTTSFVTSGQRTGSYAFRANPTTTAVGHFSIGFPRATGLTAFGASPASVQAPRLGFALKAPTLPAANEEPLVYFSSADVESLPVTPATVRLKSDGKLSIHGAGGTLLGTTTGVITSSYKYVEIYINTSTGAWEIKLDGVTDISGSGASFSENSSGNIDGITIGKVANLNGQSVDLYIDDVYVDDAAFHCVNAAAYPEVRVLLPNGAGGAAGWTNGTGSTFAEVDEVPDDADTTYIEASATEDNLYSTFAVENTTTKGVTGTIKAIQGYVRAKAGSTSGASTVGIRVRNGSTNSDAAGLELTTTYQSLFRVLNTNPATGAAWTLGGVDTVEVGMFAGTIAQTQRFTQAQIQVLAVVPALEVASPTETAAVALAEAVLTAELTTRTDSAVVVLADASAVQELTARTETLAVEVADAASTAEATARSDILALALAETAVISEVGVASDSLGLALTETAAVLEIAAPADTLEVAATEQLAGADTLSLTDGLGVALTEAAVIQEAATVADALGTTLQEAASTLEAVTAADTLDAALIEALAGADTLALADALDVMLAEVVTTLEAALATDTIIVALTDASSVDEGTTLEPVAGADSLALALLEAASVVEFAAATDTLGVSLADAFAAAEALNLADVLDIAVIEATVLHEQASVADALDVALAEALQGADTVVAADALAVAVQEAIAIVEALLAADTVTVALLEAAAVDDGLTPVVNAISLSGRRDTDIDLLGRNDSDTDLEGRQGGAVALAGRKGVIEI